MIRICLITFLLILTGCATKYILPANRFITPETNGGILKGQVELQQASASQVTVDTTKGTINDGVLYENVTRTGFMYSTSIFDQFDLYWSHIASANSMLGAKVQFLGGSKTSKAVGHKLAFAAAFGANEHETEDEQVEFTLGGRELMLLYGYRFGEYVLAYTNLSHAQYNFDGKIQGTGTALDGQSPKFENTLLSLSLGAQFDFGPFLAKLEGTYQQLDADDTKQRAITVFGWSLGYSW